MIKYFNVNFEILVKLFDLVFWQQICHLPKSTAGMPARIYLKWIQTEAYLLYYLLLCVSYTIYYWLRCVTNKTTKITLYLKLCYFC